MPTQQAVSQQLVAEITREVVSRLRSQLQQPSTASPTPASSAASGDGVFVTVDEAANASFEAQKQVAAMSLDERGRMIDIIRRICNDRREELGRMELAETQCRPPRS